MYLFKLHLFANFIYGNCHKNVVYKATVKSEGYQNKIYIESTEKPFEGRYYNHKISMETAKCISSIPLSSYTREAKTKIELQQSNRTYLRLLVMEDDQHFAGCVCCD